MLWFRPELIQVRGGVLIIHPDYAEKVIHEKLPKLGNLSQTSVGATNQQFKQQNERGGGDRRGAGHRAPLAIVLIRHLQQGRWRVFATPQDVFLMTQRANQELTTENVFWA